MSFLYVALGGAVGALGRYAISLIPTKTEFPVSTLITNLVCGGFTTFSAFSLEALNLLEKKAYFSGGCYLALSVVGCIIGVYCGRKAALFLLR